MRTNPRVNAAIAGVQALLRIGPIVVLAIGGQGLPRPDSFNDPAHALATIGSSPAVMIVAGLICATGVGQVFVVLALADRIKASAPSWVSLSVAFGIISASFLIFDGALGITALPQLAHMDVRQPMVDGAYLATLGVRNGIDRVIPLTLGIWALTAHIPAWRHRQLPRVLTATGLALGAVSVVGVVLPAAGLASLILAIGWTASFAIVLLRESGDPRINGRAVAPSPVVSVTSTWP
jgi:hypothetical protein